MVGKQSAVDLKGVLRASIGVMTRPKEVYEHGGRL